MQKPIYWAQSFPNVEGNIPWLDFIRLWAFLPHEDNPFSGYWNLAKSDEKKDENRLLILSSYFPAIGSDNQGYPSQELYFVRETENHSWSLAFAVLVDNAGGRARIQLYIEKYVDQCNKFLAQIEK